MNVTDAPFVKEFIKIATDGWLQGWHERNGGNLTYRLRPEEVESIRDQLHPQEWRPIGTSVPALGGMYFMASGSGKYMRNMEAQPEDAACIAELDTQGENYRIVWGLVHGGRPTSEFPSHLMNHEVKMQASGGRHRVIYHAHPANIIALTFVLPLRDEVFTRELWEMATECPAVFPDGIGVVPWMVPGGREIAVATSELMKKYDVAIWAHHGIFCSGEDFDSTFGLMHTVEKSAEILVKVLSMQKEGQPAKRQTIEPQDFRNLARDFNVQLPEAFLYEKERPVVQPELLNKLFLEMSRYDAGNAHRIQHFTKVHSYARMIGQSERLGSEQLFTLEAAALVHDIGIKPAMAQHGCSDGPYQEALGEPAAREMLTRLGFAPKVVERCAYLVAHHHTYNCVDGLDYRILLEADFLVNLHESNASSEAVAHARETIFRTATGLALLDSMF